MKTLTQREVDERRQGILTGMLVKAVRERERKPGTHHVRFRRPDVTCWEVRKGNPPPDVIDKRLRPGDEPLEQARFPWEKGLNLVVDLGEIKPDVALHVFKLMSERRMSADGSPDWKIPEIKDHMVNIAKESGARMPLPDAPAKVRTVERRGLEEDIETFDKRKQLLEKYEKGGHRAKEKK